MFPSPIQKHFCSRSGPSEALNSSRKETLKIQLLSLPALTHTARKSGGRILEDSALEVSARTAGQPVHVDSVWICLRGICTRTRPCLCASVHGSFLSLMVLLQSTQYYDMRWSCEHLIMVWINAFVMLTTQLLPSKYCDLLHKSAAHLGKWQKLEHGSYSNAPQHM